MTSTFKKLAVAAAGTALSFAVMPDRAALAATFSNPYGVKIENAQLGEKLTVRDMTLTRSGQNTTLGNGIDETIAWSFDFNNDPNLQAFLDSSAQLTSAQLTFSDIGITNQRVTTDRFGIPGYGGRRFGLGSQVTPMGAKIINVPDIPGIPEVGEFAEVSINLLDHGFTSSDLLPTFSDDTPHTNPFFDDREGGWIGTEEDHRIRNAENVIPWIYHDDAIITGASLQLEKADGTSISTTVIAVPEPSTVAAFAVLALGLLLKNKKKIAFLRKRSVS
ncbi:MAG: PEP-CTERM sorting domain-containing protein [Xenococcaceae cyanobacterium]